MAEGETRNVETEAVLRGVNIESLLREQANAEQAATAPAPEGGTSTAEGGAPPEDSSSKIPSPDVQAAAAAAAAAAVASPITSLNGTIPESFFENLKFNLDSHLEEWISRTPEVSTPTGAQEGAGNAAAGSSTSQAPSRQPPVSSPLAQTQSAQPEQLPESKPPAPTTTAQAIQQGLSNHASPKIAPTPSHIGAPPIAQRPTSTAEIQARLAQYTGSPVTAGGSASPFSVSPPPLPPTKPVNMSNDEWDRTKKDNHKEVERRRREAINEGINELKAIVPNCEKNKGSILQRAVQYINQLKEAENANIDKWTLEKLLIDQAMSDSRQEVDELKNRVAQLEAEVEYWTRRYNSLDQAVSQGQDGVKRRREDE